MIDFSGFVRCADLIDFSERDADNSWREWRESGSQRIFPEARLSKVGKIGNFQSNRSDEVRAMRHCAAGMITLLLTLTAGCCATCHHSACGIHRHAVPGAVYGEDMAVEYHPGPLAWLWRLLGIGRGYPCDDCGPRYWGDWGGDPAGCEACDDYGQWGGTPTVTSRPIVMPSSGRMTRTNDCPECAANSSQGVTRSANDSSGKASLAARPDEKLNPQR